MTKLHSGGKFNSKVYETSGRPAWRWRFGRQRAVGPPRSRSGARPPALPAALLARRPAKQARAAWRCPQPARHQDPVPSRSGDFRQERRLRAGAALPDGALQGLSVRRRRDPLELRSAADQGQGPDAGQGRVPFPGRTEGLSRRLARRRVPGDARDLRREKRQAGRPWRHRMGGHLVRRRRLRQFLLQHHPDR